MTPKEKARELIELYEGVIVIKYEETLPKRCAIQAVKQILIILDNVSTISGNYFRGTETHGYVDADVEEKYWKDVLNELLK
jgi:hypothetical protein